MNSREIWMEGVKRIREDYPFGTYKEKRNIEGELHCETGPAVTTPTFCAWYFNGRKHGMFVDIYGTKIYYFRGILVPNHYVEEPYNLTVDDVLGNNNQEVRYAGLEIYGLDRMIDEGHFKILHEDDSTDARLMQFNKKKDAKDALEEPLTVVQVINGTAEPDGTRKKYLLKVPPTVKTCAEAIAWTFGLEAKDYHPEVET